MRVAVSGSTGLVGSEVVTVLSVAGHEVVRLVRRPPAPVSTVAGASQGRWIHRSGSQASSGTHVRT